MGRLFDAVASLCGVRQIINYEAQAAIEFEMLADTTEIGEYDITLERANNSNDKPILIDNSRMMEQIIIDIQNQVPLSKISARFHNTIARIACVVSEQIRNEYGVNNVVLSGGVWQNLTLLRLTNDLLQSKNFDVLIHHQVPTNDGGIALGQAVVAIHRMMK
jgi:hydrogenase maturation protein HypF